MQRKITVTGANKVFFWVIIIFLGFSYAIGILSVLLRKNIATDNFHITIIITQFVLILLPVLIYVLKNRLNFKEVFRLNKLGLLPAFIIVINSIFAILAAGSLNVIVLFLLQQIGKVPPDSIPVPKSFSEMLITLLVLSISPAICEEALHRGILLRSYEKRGTIKAIVISSIMFGIFHFDIKNLLGPIFLGMVIAYYVVRTNSIFAGVLAHFSNNAIASISSYLVGGSETDSAPITLADLENQLIFGMGCFIVMVILLAVFKKVTQDTAQYNPPIASVRNDIKSILSHWPIVVVLVLYIISALMTIVSQVLT